MKKEIKSVAPMRLGVMTAVTMAVLSLVFGLLAVLFGGGAQNFQHADLGIEVQSVTRLGFYGGGAVGKKCVESSECPGEELGLGSGAGGSDGGVDTATRVGNVHVGFALQTPVKFFFAEIIVNPHTSSSFQRIRMKISQTLLKCLICIDFLLS